MWYLKNDVKSAAKSPDYWTINREDLGRRLSCFGSDCKMATLGAVVSPHWTLWSLCSVASGLEKPLLARYKMAEHFTHFMRKKYWANHWLKTYSLIGDYLHTWKTLYLPSSNTQRQIVGARESLNEWENMAQRKLKNGEKSPWGQCLSRLVPNCCGRSGFWLVPENYKSFLCAIFSRPFRLSLAPTICPWISEDVYLLNLPLNMLYWRCT